MFGLGGRKSFVIKYVLCIWAFLIVGMILAFFLLSNTSIYPISKFSALQRVSEVQALLQDNLVLQQSNLQEVQAFFDKQSLHNCETWNNSLICFTAAPPTLGISGNILNDLGFYMIVKNAYRIICKFDNNLLVEVKVDYTSTGF